MCERPPCRCSCHSMAGMCSGCRFYMTGAKAKVRIALLAFFMAKRHSGIQLVEVSLKAFFGVFGQAREFDPHANPRVAGANHGGGAEPLLFDPQIHAQRRTNGEWHDRFNITTVPADISGIYPQGSIHALVA